MKSRINNLKEKIDILDKDYNKLNGRVDTLSEQLDNILSKLAVAKETQEINTKAIELLNYIQKETRDVIIEVFENVVTKALQFIHQSDDYKFELEFGQRGNLPELKFNLKTPDMNDSHDIMSTRAGGSKDIIALALRFVLLEVSKSPGFLFADEIEKRLDNEETVEKMIEFIKETQKNTGRQIILITHKQEMVDAVDDPIILEKNSTVEVKDEQKRGRLERKRRNKC